MLDPLYKLIGSILAFFYSVVPPHNLGLAIILLTCTVMLVLFPLTAKQARSMIAMQKVQPEIKKIQARYKDDKQKQNEEVMKFYRENKINPLSGCLPLLMQMPVFIALFRVLRDIESNIPTTGSFARLFHDICGSATSPTQCDPQGLHFLGMNLSVSPLEASKVANGFLETLPYYVMVALVVLTGWYQSRQTMARQGAGANPQAQIVGKVMPILFGVFALNFVAGLVVYFVTSNVWRIGQQQLVLNRIYEEGDAKAGPKVVEASSRDVSDAGEGAPEAPRPRRVDPNTSRKKARKRKKKRKR